MMQLILHGIGDYVVQTNKWAIGKKNKGLYGFMCCLKHCVTYSLPFKFIGSWWAVLVIFLTHFIIDRSQLVAYFLAIKNNVKYRHMYDIRNYGFPQLTPPYLSIWLLFITDNIFHIICNFISLKYL